MGRPEHGVGHAAHEEGHPGPPPADGRQEFRELWPRGDGRRDQREHLPQTARNQIEQPQTLGPLVDPQALCQAHRGHGQADPVPIREDPQQDQLPEPVEPLGRAGVALVHGQPKGLDQPPVLHARRTRRLAGPAIQAEIQVAPKPPGDAQLAFGDQAHQVDSAAGAVVFVAQLGVRRARGRAQPAVHALEEQAVLDPLPGIFAARSAGVWLVVGAHGLR